MGVPIGQSPEKEKSQSIPVGHWISIEKKKKLKKKDPVVRGPLILLKQARGSPTGPLSGFFGSVLLDGFYFDLGLWAFCGFVRCW